MSVSRRYLYTDPQTGQSRKVNRREAVDCVVRQFTYYGFECALSGCSACLRGIRDGWRSSVSLRPRP